VRGAGELAEAEFRHPAPVLLLWCPLESLSEVLDPGSRAVLILLKRATSHATRALNDAVTHDRETTLSDDYCPSCRCDDAGKVGLSLGSGMSPLGRPVADDAIALPWLPNVLAQMALSMR
jgi:hypothetical protein